ncbi:MAG: flagellar basal body rod protein FlgB [Thermoguttaceae bacterium]
MFDGILQSSTVPILEQVVQFTEARQNVLAGNLANMHTPGYRARDISVADFQTRLKAAIEERERPAPPMAAVQSWGMPSPGDVGAAHVERPIGKVAEDSQNIVYHDDSNINMEQQATEMAKNQMQHNLAVALLVSQFNQMQTVISERI